ncbi:uncharacterized protein LOC115228403 [Octopus sinensis]|uniref:Uncharacterized protein LOC115228403 n=1 Tax=Octopus sinensis TaxID=2607531 RepID=A0A6P7TRJ6_9MOLL|nr:uncharacterized protein LOC115228403 [Octopus sinensis]
MNNNRAAGYDGVPGELLKYAPNSLASFFAQILNKAFAQHCLLPIGTGIIIPVQKPGKRRGPCGSLRPVVLVTSLRKTLSTIVRSRISRSVDRYLSCSQSGFRPGRSTADIVWTHRWINAICQKYKRSFYVLGIDMSKAFDSINRCKLLIVLKNIVDEDSLRMKINFYYRKLNFLSELALRSLDYFLQMLEPHKGTHYSLYYLSSI